TGLAEFELDLTKMPLGKLSKKQLEKAYGMLSQAREMLDSKDVSKTKFLDISNQFYTLIPHDFGRKTPPVLSDNEIIKSKLEMLESLVEIEVAFSLLKAGDAVKDKDPIDAHYEKLNTEIEVLDKVSEEFSVIQTYAKNTHAATHTQYTLEVEEVFKVVRKGESKRFRPFSKLPNRKLLWHGSRVFNNMAGILSQGLRIAPPEAPITGYMFGKGIYFADMVSKSANYCVTSKSNPVGMSLLCDVALGKSQKRKEADYIEKLKKDYQSVLGVGKTEPNPDEFKRLGDVKVPLGKPAPTKVKGSSLLYNEYIVFDVAQVNIKYLIKTKFHYK
ncbi:poly [ADP-ribose] polymerase 1-like, partial [Daphnia pulex]|uniref:poly [ADP-ribose] polymerase 1-like n=1 Tax=Daphnia pulex TaxID=6669 RepID=UPI001EDE209A